jgi:hypothetical protein
VDDKPTVSPAVNPDGTIFKNLIQIRITQWLTVLLDLLPLEERLKKKKYNGQLAANVVRQDLIELKKGLMVAKTIEETVPISKAIRDLKVVRKGKKEKTLQACLCLSIAFSCSSWMMPERVFFLLRD